MSDTLFSTILQLLVFTLIPFIVYVIQQRKIRGFLNYIGLKASTRKANILALAVSLLFAFPAIVLTFLSETFRELLIDPATISGHFRAMGFSTATLLMIALTAIFKTALTEEILFRGFLAKRLMAWLGYTWGNIAQALVFGLIHLAVFMAISDDWFFPIVIFVFSGLGAYISAYLNEKLADGSIIPGWISHALANLLSYSAVAFVL